MNLQVDGRYSRKKLLLFLLLFSLARALQVYIAININLYIENIKQQLIQLAGNIVA